MEMQEVIDTAGIMWALRLAVVVPYAAHNPICVAWEVGFNHEIEVETGLLTGVDPVYLRVVTELKRKLLLIPLCSITCIAKAYSLRVPSDTLYVRRNGSWIHGE